MFLLLILIHVKCFHFFLLYTDFLTIQSYQHGNFSLKWHIWMMCCMPVVNSASEYQSCKLETAVCLTWEKTRVFMLMLVMDTWLSETWYDRFTNANVKKLLWLNFWNKGLNHNLMSFVNMLPTLYSELRTSKPVLELNYIIRSLWKILKIHVVIPLLKFLRLFLILSF